MHWNIKASKKQHEDLTSVHSNKEDAMASGEKWTLIIDNHTDITNRWLFRQIWHHLTHDGLWV